MTDPSTIQAALLAGESFYADQAATILSNYPTCLPLPCGEELKRFSYVTAALRYQVDNNIYNGTTEELYTLLEEYLGNYNPATVAVIALTQPANMNVGDPDQTLTATSNSPAAITFSTSDANVATIVNGKLHAVGGGTCTVTATQAATTGYTSASTTSQAITFTAIITTVINFTQPNNMQVGDADQTLVATSNSPAAITFSSSDTTKATIVSGKLHAVAPGAVTITASQPAQAPYTSGSAQKTDTILATLQYGNSATDPTGNLPATLPNKLGFTLGSSSVQISWPTSYDQSFIIFAVPHGQPVFTTWYNSALNQGQIPDQLYYAMVTVNNLDYYYTRQIATIDPQNPVFTYSV